MDEGGDPLSQRLSSMGSGHDAFSRSAEADEVLGSGAEAAAAGLLEPDLLPFPRGPLTFGTGVSLKMAVSRLNSWAADCGVKEERLPQVRELHACAGRAWGPEGGVPARLLVPAVSLRLMLRDNSRFCRPRGYTSSCCHSCPCVCCAQAGRSTEMSDYRLFPCLRATADLLMMPKEVGLVALT